MIQRLILIAIVCVGCARNATPPSNPMSAFSPENIADVSYVESCVRIGLPLDAQNASFSNRDYLLTYAVRHGAIKTVEYLLDAGANVDIASSGFKKTPLFQAAHSNQLKIAQVLLDHGANVNALDDMGNNALREAILAGHADMVSLLIKAGCDPKTINAQGESMIDLAQQYGTSEIRNLLK